VFPLLASPDRSLGLQYGRCGRIIDQNTFTIRGSILDPSCGVTVKASFLKDGRGNSTGCLDSTEDEGSHSKTRTDRNLDQDNEYWPFSNSCLRHKRAS